MTDTTCFIDPLSLSEYPIDIPRWRSDEGRPLMETPCSGISRADINSSTRSLWRYRAAILAPAGFDRLADAGLVAPDELTVILLSGTGLKALSS